MLRLFLPIQILSAYSNLFKISRVSNLFKISRVSNLYKLFKIFKVYRVMLDKYDTPSRYSLRKHCMAFRYIAEKFAFSPTLLAFVSFSNFTGIFE